jgi:hypothetical protein
VIREEDDRFRLQIGAALGAAVVLRLLALLVPVDPFVNPDALAFADLARSVAEHGRLAYVDSGAPAIELRAFRSLLYPVFLAPFLGGPLPAWLALAAQALLGIAGIAGIAFLARRALGARVAVVTAWIGALYTPSIWYERQWTSEALFTPLLVLGAVLAARATTARAALLAGMALGLGTWTRPAALAAAAAILLVVLVINARATGGPANRGHAALALAAGLALALGPGLVRNARVIGAPVLLTSGGMNVWIGNGRGSVGEAWEVMGRDLATRGEVGMDRWFYADTRAHSAEILADAPRLLAGKLAVYFSPTTRDPWLLPWRFVWPLALLGLVLARWRDPRAASVIAAVLVSQTAVALLTVPWARYRLPMEPFVWPLAAAASVRLWDGGPAGRATLAAILGVCVALLAFQVARGGWYP